MFINVPVKVLDPSLGLEILGTADLGGASLLMGGQPGNIVLLF